MDFFEKLSFELYRPYESAACSTDKGAVTGRTDGILLRPSFASSTVKLTFTFFSLGGNDGINGILIFDLLLNALSCLRDV